MRNGCASSEVRAGGFTLLELMVSLLILGLVLGAGIGALTSFDPGSSAGRGVISNTLRQARNDALAYGAPSRVSFDPVAGTLRSVGFRVAGTWRFEEGRLDGSTPVPATAEGFAGVFSTPDGFIGDGLDLAAGDLVARVEFDLTEDPIFKMREGYRISLAVRPQPGDAAGRILDLGEVVTLDLEANGALDVRMATAGVDELGRTREGEAVRLLSPAGALEGGRWSEVAIRYDGDTFALLVNGVTLAERSEARPVWGSTGTLSLGGGRRSFRGALDDLVVAVVRVDTATPLPRSTALLAKEPFDVHFDTQGHLDPVFHGGPVDVELEFLDGRTSTVRVMPAGTVL